MSKSFEIGAYYHTLKEIDVAGIDRATFFESAEITSENLKVFHHQHPKISISLAFEKKEYQQTLRVHHGMDLSKECRGPIKRVALPSDIELLKTLDLRSLAALDVKIDLMAFDYHRPEAGGRTNFHTLLFAWEGPSALQTIQYLHDHGIHPEQISLGLARFGMMFKNVLPGMVQTGYGQVSEGPQLEKPQMSAQEIAKYLKNSSAKLFYTSIKGCFQSFIYNPENGDWISFDDDLTLKAKKEWARRQKLGGIFFI